MGLFGTGRIARLEERLKRLEERVDRTDRKLVCTGGSHEWEAKLYDGVVAYVRCMHCYERKEGKG